MLAPVLAAPAQAAQGIAWRACADAEFAGLQCGTMRVPVEWSTPRGAQIELALVRRAAGDPARRQGTLVLNNGAGRSAIEQLRLAMRSGFPELAGAMTQRFDIVAIDPRGVGHSAPVRCAVPMKGEGVTHFPQDRGAFRRLAEHNRGFGEDCLRRNGPLVANVDSVSAARDFEALRVKLGERQLNWYGIMHSTLLGRTYAALFPGRLRTLNADTALDDTVSPLDQALNEASAAEDSFDRFAAWCGTDDRCALKGHDVGAEYDALVARADREPIPVEDGRPLTGEDIREATQESLDLKGFFWPRLAGAIAKARGGDASGFATAADRTLDRVQEQVGGCLDTHRQIRTFKQAERAQKALKARSPHLGGAVSGWAKLIGCVGWPVPAKPARAGGRVPQGPKALVVQSTHQAHAPHSAGRAFAGQLPGSVVLSREGDDYSMFLSSACVRDATNQYLTDLVLPAPGTVCTD
ncbi:alpha/beta fold hydrolase [Actinomadura litoris]|uniref:Alpha/beta fold hydrolase n=1 Tax=Actinomadura litoris TaxID=2678616 RepID=A0A7K1L1G7_9ACTN|nr:alpha/beta fold hydrolase [Actinomadura litoris]MUN38290.1 alpha/beta fold hydrolase [Actinomadura litoris]